VNPGPGIPQTAQKMALVPRPKPGAQGSYAIVGMRTPPKRIETFKRKIHLPFKSFNSATLNADFYSQAHISLSSNRFGQTNPNYDQRLYDTIKTGLKPGFNFLSYIKPLGQTVLHEVSPWYSGLLPTSFFSNKLLLYQLTHVAGGRKSFSRVALQTLADHS
jgi:hypothetical protein